MFHQVAGTVRVGADPVANAGVSIDNVANWTTETDADGHFLLQDVTEGEHELGIRYVSEVGSFSEESQHLLVFSDLDLDGLRLPIPVVLDDPSDVTEHEMTLTWSQTDAVDFREYKLYRHDSSGLDETTGELIHVSTSRADVTFTDTDLGGDATYFYRVYVMNDLGRLGGSNIVSATTVEACPVDEYEITPIDPLPGATDHDPSAPIRLRWGEVPIDAFTGLQTEGGTFLTPTSSDETTLEWSLTYALSAGATYHLMVGWFCFANAEETTVTALDFTFSTAP